MARPKVYSIRLTDDERTMLNKVIKNKATCKTVLKRCQILRDLDEIKDCWARSGNHCRCAQEILKRLIPNMSETVRAVYLCLLSRWEA